MFEVNYLNSTLNVYLNVLASLHINCGYIENIEVKIETNETKGETFLRRFTFGRFQTTSGDISMCWK